MEEEIKALKRGSGEIKEQVNSGENNLEEDKVFENKVLECEKKNVESKTSDGEGVCHLQAGTPPNDTLCELRNGIKEEKKGTSLEADMALGKARRRLEFNEDRSPCKIIAPPTPGRVIPFTLSDTDDKLPFALDLAMKNFLKQKYSTSNNDEKDIYDCKEDVLSAPKRKRASTVLTSDSESRDVNIPISVKRMHLQVGSDPNGCLEIAIASVVDNDSGSVTSPRQSLVTSETKKEREYEASEAKFSASKSVKLALEGNIKEEVNSGENDLEEDKVFELKPENKVLECKKENADCKAFDEIPSTIQRNFETYKDMQKAFDKDPELCMEAVCALYRRQTPDERERKETIYLNGRGFNKEDAPRGSELGEFLTDGPFGDLKLKKTLKELLEHDPEAIVTCREIAKHYPWQLFQLYKNKEKEDALFLASFLPF